MQLTSNIAQGVGHPEAPAGDGVGPLPAAGGEDEEEVGAAALAGHTPEPGAVPVRPAHLDRDYCQSGWCRRSTQNVIV